MDVSIIIVNYNTRRLLDQCLQSIMRHTGAISYEVIVVDNASIDDSKDVVRTQYPGVTLVESRENLGFSRGNNLGCTSAVGKYLLFLNTDTLLIENSVAVMTKYLDDHPDVGAIGPKLVFEDRSFQLSAGRLPTIATEAFDKVRYALLRKWRRTLSPIFNAIHSTTASVGWITGACMMVRADAFRQVGGFDENLFMYFEDKDLCIRLKLVEWKIIYHPETSVIHLLAGSSTADGPGMSDGMYRTSQLHYYRKHLNELRNRLLHIYLKSAGKTQ
jgi:N-acetylglucosaminyl-diphospho-decaprenol L-rhamnosyltransferase